METIETYKGFDINVGVDECNCDPREWGNLGVMVCEHPRYDLGDKHDLNFGDFKNGQELEAYLKKELNAVVVLPLSILDHSGLWMKVGTSFAEDTGGWDTSFVGFVYATKEAIQNEYGVKRITKNILRKAENILRTEVEIYSQFISGEVYFFNVTEDKEETIDSCGGFYGYNHEKSGLLESAKSAIDCHAEEIKQKRQKKLKAFIRNNVPLINRCLCVL